MGKRKALSSRSTRIFFWLGPRLSGSQYYFYAFNTLTFVPLASLRKAIPNTHCLVSKNVAVNVKTVFEGENEKKEENGKVSEVTCVKRHHNYWVRSSIKNHRVISWRRNLALQNEVRLKAATKKKNYFLDILNTLYFFTPYRVSIN